MSSKLPPYQPPSVFRPFLRRFTDERARDLSETIALYDEVRSSFLASHWAREDAIERVSSLIADDVGAAVTLPGSLQLLRALDNCQRAVLQLETTIFTSPKIDWDAPLSLREQVDLRRFLRAQEHFLAHDDHVAGLMAATLSGLFAGIIRSIPSFSDDDEAAFTVPLVSQLRNPRDVVDAIIGTLCTKPLAEAGLFTDLQQRFYENTCRASGVAPDDDKPRRPLITAAESDLEPHALVETYLAGTPFLDLLLSPVPFSLPDNVRFEHMHVIGGSGHGKTQLLQHLIVHDLARDDPPALIVIDSQGDMLRKIQGLQLFADDPNRLVIVDPEQYSPALNMFDTANVRAERYSELHREQLQAGVVELYNYIFASIAAEMTSRQSTAFAFVSRLMLSIPGATIHTLRELMEDSALSIAESPFRDAVEKLEPTARAYFQNQFFTKRYADLRQQIARRLYGVLSVPAFDRMFSAKHNSLDMFEAMQSGKVILVNTSKALLKSDASALFGRYMIALVIRAVYERVAATNRRPAFLIVDEASEYFDDNIQMLLEQARKFNVGLVLAHQHLDQLSTSLRSAIAANTGIKLAGGVNERDARALAPDMRTSAEFITAMTKHAHSTEFACHVRNVTGRALRLEVPFGVLESAPQMSKRASASLLSRNRKRYAAESDSPRLAAATREAPTPDASEPGNDGWRS